MKVQRIKWIDIAKGIGIICIVVGHTLRGTGIVIQWLYSFNVPFFFILSGLTYKKEMKIKEIVKAKSRQLLIPYGVFSLASIVVFAILGGRISSISTDGFITDGVLPNLFGAVYANSRTGLMKWNTPLWFLPCLFIVEVIGSVWEMLINIICKCGKKTEAIRIIVTICSMVIGWLFGGKIFRDVKLPFHLETAFILSAYFELGIFIRGKMRIGYAEVRENSRLYGMVLCIGLFFLGLITVKYNWLADIRLMKFGNSMILYVIASMLNSFTLLLLSFCISEFKLFEYIGKNTMKILVMHKFPVLFFQTLIPITAEILTQESDTIKGCFVAILVSIVAVFLCIIVGNITEKILPWLYGRYK